MKITNPTKVQEAVYGAFMEGKDIIAKDKTGSGKTLAYLIPCIERALARMEEDHSRCRTIILLPTYELVMQVQHVTLQLLQKSQLDLRSVALPGNANIKHQVDALKGKPEIIIGTSGRVLELIQMKKISGPTIATLVVDEADHMMDKYNLDGLKAVKKCLYKDTQIAFFSASMNEKAIRIAKELSTEPFLALSKEEERIPASITHLYIKAPRNEKIEALRSLLSTEECKDQKIMLFVNRTYDAEEVYEKLSFHHYKVCNLVGTKDKKERKDAMEGFLSGKYQILISTDLAARGMDISDIYGVINLYLPTDSRDYLHRAGRCGRQGKPGICMNLLTINESKRLSELENQFSIHFQEAFFEHGKLKISSK